MSAIRIVWPGRQHGETFDEHRRVRLGSGDNCDVQFDGDGVRADHGRLEFRSGTWVFEDRSDGHSSVSEGGRLRPLDRLTEITSRTTLILGDQQVLLEPSRPAAAAAASPAAASPEPARRPEPARPASSDPPVGDEVLVVRWPGGERSLSPGTYSLGRAPSAALAFPDAGSVSGRHGELRYGPDGWVYEDLGSSNGTRVGGVGGPRAVGPVPLVGSVQLHLGADQHGVTLDLVAPGSPAGPATIVGHPAPAAPTTFDLVAPAGTVNVTCDQPVPMQLTVENFHDVDALTVQLTVEGVPAEWVRFQSVDGHAPGMVGTSRSESREVPFTLVVPRVPTARAGRHRVELMATSVSGGGRVSKAFTIEIDPYLAFETRVTPTRSRARGNKAAVHHLELTNQGNSVADVKFPRSDEADELRLEFDRAPVTIAPEETVDVTVSMEAKDSPGLLKGRDYDWAFTGTAVEEIRGGRQEIPLAGKYRRKPLIPWWLPLLLLLLVLALVWWFTRPDEPRTMPDVASLTVDEAFAEIEESTRCTVVRDPDQPTGDGCELIGRVNEIDVDGAGAPSQVGTVDRADPAPGQELDSGDIVTLNVFADDPKLPNLADLSLEDAERLLQSGPFAGFPRRLNGSSDPQGKVIRTVPSEGTALSELQAEESAEIIVFVEPPPPTTTTEGGGDTTTTATAPEIVMPDLTDMLVSEALQVLEEERGVDPEQVVVDYEVSDAKDRAVVLASDPEADDELDDDPEIALTAVRRGIGVYPGPGDPRPEWVAPPRWVADDGTTIAVDVVANEDLRDPKAIRDVLAYRCLVLPPLDELAGNEAAIAEFLSAFVDSGGNVVLLADPVVDDDDTDSVSVVNAALGRIGVPFSLGTEPFETSGQDPVDLFPAELAAASPTLPSDGLFFPVGGLAIMIEQPQTEGGTVVAAGYSDWLESTTGSVTPPDSIVDLCRADS